MDGSLFAFGAEMRNAAVLSTGYWIVGAKKCRHPASGRRRERTE